MPKFKLAASFCMHDDDYYLTEAIRAVSDAAPVFVFVSRLPWNGAAGDWERAAATAQEAGAEAVLGDWDEELMHRGAACDWLRAKGFTHALIPDTDEILEPQLLDTLVKIARAGLAESVSVELDTYWKSPEYLIRPRENLQAQTLIDLRQTKIAGIRIYDGGRRFHLPSSYGVLHHLSYCGPDARIARKISTWSHKQEVRPGWWEDVWLRWDDDKLMRHLHPTHPKAYGWAERIPVPDMLQGAYERWSQVTGLPRRQTSGKAEDLEPAVAADTKRTRSKKKPVGPKLSIIIPLHGGPEDIRSCLSSLETCADLVHETIVVDDASPDNAPQAAAEFSGVRVIRNENTRGFAGTCNTGYAASTGDLVLFLNSDTIVPRIGLVRLLQALLQSDEIAGVGPLSNWAGPEQRIFPTYSSMERLDLFAEDMAHRERPDTDTDMLSGFCLLARREALDEVGLFDTRFGLGTFEDNDLSYRMRRAGYRLLIANRSYIHHQYSRTFDRLNADMNALLKTNSERFTVKWRRDIESGFASHLSGMEAAPVRFDESRRSASAANRGASDPMSRCSTLFVEAIEDGDWARARQQMEAVAQAEGCGRRWAEMALLLAVSLGEDPASLIQASGGGLRPGGRLVLARRLLHEKREEEALPHLLLLQREGVAEAAFYLGQMAEGQKKPRAALGWFERALQLNPAHAATQERVAQLRGLLSPPTA